MDLDFAQRISLLDVAQLDQLHLAPRKSFSNTQYTKPLGHRKMK